MCWLTINESVVCSKKSYVYLIDNDVYKTYPFRRLMAMVLILVLQEWAHIFILSRRSVRYVMYLSYAYWSNIKRKLRVLLCTSDFCKTVDSLCKLYKETLRVLISLFHRAFFNSIMDKTPTHALFTQHYISLPCWFH